MKCIFTGKEIDELKDFTPKTKDVRDVQRHELARQDHWDELAKWEQIRVTVLRDGHPLEIFVGMVSPDVQLMPGDVTVTKVTK